MADENVIGVEARLEVDKFEAGKRRLDSMVASLEKNLDSFERKQAENAKRVADATNKQADDQEKSAKRIEDATKRAAAEDEKSANKRERSIRKFGLAFAAVSIAVVKGYEALKDAANRLGDEGAIAGFKAVDESLANLRDTFDAVVLKALPLEEMLNGVAAGFTALSQIVSLAGGGIVRFATVAIGELEIIGKRLDEMRRGQIFSSSMNIEEEFRKLNERAAQAGNQVILAGATAPERRATVTREVDAEKEANKQRAKTAQNIVDYNQKIRDLQIKAGESILDAEKDYHDKSGADWQAYIEKTSEIIGDGMRKRAELARDYSDKISSAESDYQRSVEDASYEHGKKLADIERDYQRTIQNIQQTYQEDSLDAIRNLDAIGLIRAKEKRDKDLANAQTSRDQANSDEGQNYSRQLYELQRSLDDKRNEAQAAYKRGLDDQRLAEQEALQANRDAYSQQATDTRRALDDKLSAIQQSYANENAAASAQYGYSETAYRNHLQAMQAITAQYGIGTTTSTRGPGTLNRRQHGGLDVVNGPTQFLAGEAGPELVYTAPLNRTVPVATPQIVNHVGDFQHSIDSTIRSSVAGMDGRIIAAISKVLREVIG